MLAAMRFAPMSWLAAFLMLTSFAYAEDPQRILFIGNSYTGLISFPMSFWKWSRAPVARSQW